MDIDEKIKDLYLNQRKSIKKIALMLELNQAIVRKYLCLMNVQIKKRTKFNSINVSREDFLMLCIKHNFFVDAIAKEYGISWNSAKKLFNDYKIPNKPSLTDNTEDLKINFEKWSNFISNVKEELKIV